jgi:hypothetical protein
VLSPSANAASISIASPGGSPAGYIPLEAFGVAPTPIGDDAIINFTVPTFQSAGQSWGSVGVVSNGYVVVGGGTNPPDVSFVPSSFPNPAAPNNVLAPFWADLVAPVGGGIRIATLTDGVRTWIVVDWNQFTVFGTTRTQSFELWLGINGFEEIYYTYGLMDLGGFNFRVGAEDSTGTVGANYLGLIVSNETDLRVSSEGLPLAPVVPLPATLPLFASGAGVLAYLGWRRKRKMQAAA